MQSTPGPFSSVSRPILAVLVLLGVFALVTRLTTPWRLDVINDEMHHLESWRNHYGSDDIYPLFLQRLESSGKLSPARLEWARWAYHLHPLTQRALIVLVDPQPPLYPVLAELTQWTTSSSLILLRWWSVLFSLSAIYVAYRLGRSIYDDASGLWIAIFAGIGATTQFYAGIGRPYALTQLTILLALWAFVAYLRQRISLRRFLFACLLAQGVQWMAWSVVGPLVAIAIAHDLRRNAAGLRPLARWLWRYSWYVVGSLLLLSYMLVQLQNPTVSDQGGVRSAWRVWWCYAVVSPFSHLGSFGDSALHIGAAAFALLALAGAIWLVWQRQTRGLLAAGLLASAACGILAAIVIGVEVRFAVTYVTPAIVLGGLGASAISSLPRLDLRPIMAAATLAFFGALAIFHPENPYERIDQYDVPWSQAASALKQNLKPGQTWIAYPPNLANNLYRYGPLPEPIMPLNEAQLQTAIAANPGALAMVERSRTALLPGMQEFAISAEAEPRVALGRLP